jgi:NitT/TauT family transport system substrate-binding protein
VSNQRKDAWSRREFLSTAALAGTGALLGLRSDAFAAEPPPETSKVRVIENSEICAGTPLIVAQELLKAEGFKDVHPVKTATGVDGVTAVAKGEADFSITAAPSLVRLIDAGEQLVVLSGIHIGCFELFGTERIRSLRDLKGKRVGVSALGSGRHIFLASMLAHVGLDPRQDVDWITRPVAESMQMFAKGEIDAFMGFPPEPQELRAKKDRPCGRQHNHRQTLVAVLLLHAGGESRVRTQAPGGNEAISPRVPEGGKRLRPRTAARGETAHGQRLYSRLRVRAPNDQGTALRPMARLRPRGHGTLLCSSPARGRTNQIKPAKIISQGTDWRFLRELKKELKA